MSDGPPEKLDPRIDRNWSELLQELRVAQTGVQILTALLLTVPFSGRFDALSDEQRAVYVGVLLCAMTSMLLLLTPVALHRQLFHRGERPWLVDAANQLSRAGLVLLVVANIGTTWLVVDVVVNETWAIIVAVVLTVMVAALWIALPAWIRKADR